MTALPQMGLDLLAAARKWAVQRALLRRALDSKTAKPQAVEQVKADYRRSSDELERVIVHIEKTVSALAPARKTKGTPFPWDQFFGIVMESAKTIQSVVAQRNLDGVRTDDEGFVRAEVIDVKPPKGG